MTAPDTKKLISILLVSLALSSAAPPAAQASDGLTTSDQQLAGRRVVVVLNSQDQLRGILVARTADEVVIDMGHRVETLPADDVKALYPDYTALPANATSQTSLVTQAPSKDPDDDKIFLARALAPTAGLVVPGIGQHIMGKNGLGTLLSIVGYAGMGASIGAAVHYTSDPTFNDSSVPVIAVGAIAYGITYLVGIADAAGTYTSEEKEKMAQSRIEREEEQY